MSTSKKVAIILFIGVVFNMAGRVSAVEMDCIPTQPHAGAPVCFDIPHGPRFWGRR